VALLRTVEARRALDAGARGSGAAVFVDESSSTVSSVAPPEIFVTKERNFASSEPRRFILRSLFFAATDGMAGVWPWRTFLKFDRRLEKSAVKGAISNFLKGSFSCSHWL